MQLLVDWSSSRMRQFTQEKIMTLSKHKTSSMPFGIKGVEPPVKTPVPTPCKTEIMDKVFLWRQQLSPFSKWRMAFLARRAVAPAQRVSDGEQESGPGKSRRGRADNVRELRVPPSPMSSASTAPKEN